MGGILGAALGESPAEAQARIEEAKKTATDLTGLVRRKKAKTEAGTDTNGTNANGADTNGAATATNGKRKAEEMEEAPASDEEGSKKARVEEIQDAEA
jgi:HAT1-interacting factor 1